ncbi:MAG: XRE family transcriptional regulator [Pseudomonas veronii]|uniref:helix-turn-helix domain-containing protein n=1 Tax=Pseudomonas veronii TaxID=76761 RepID=UPI001E5E987E|nr:XRE family transcriptional regulator [Pseudomonas veronii]
MLIKFQFSNGNYDDPVKADTRSGITAAHMRHIGTIMDSNIVDLQKVRDGNNDAQIRDYYLYLPPKLTPLQCSQGRTMLTWSCEALAFRSGASVKAIREFESGSRELRAVTRQALAYALEVEGLLFFPGCKPVKSKGYLWSTLDPRQRDDYYLIE